MFRRINKNRIVRAGGHTGLAANANRFIEIDDAINALEHRSCRTSRDTGRVGALITSSHLVRATHLRKYAHVDVLHIGSGHADRYDVLGLACRRTCMTTDAPGMVDDLGPLHAVVADWLCWIHCGLKAQRKYITHVVPKSGNWQETPDF